MDPGRTPGNGSHPLGLVTAAGVQGPIGPLVDCDMKDWVKDLSINLLGTVFAVKYFARELISGNHRGRIVLLSGGGATSPQPRFSSYGAAKAAVVRFGEVMAHELKEHKIAVNSLAPGGINTQFTEEVVKAGPDRAGREAHERALEQKTSGGTSVDKPASLCSYLMSESAEDVTGRLISAVWDPWSHLHEHVAELQGSDIYTLRRIVPKDRARDWGE